MSNIKSWSCENFCPGPVFAYKVKKVKHDCLYKNIIKFKGPLCI